MARRLPPVPNITDLGDRSQLNELKQFLQAIRDTLGGDATKIGISADSDEPETGDIFVDEESNKVRVRVEGEYKTLATDEPAPDDLGVVGDAEVGKDLRISGDIYNKPSMVRVLTTPYYVKETDRVLKVDSTSSAMDVYLMDALEGHPIVVIKADASANPVNVRGWGTQRISGSATQPIVGAWNSLHMYPDVEEERWLVK